MPWKYQITKTGGSFGAEGFLQQDGVTRHYRWVSGLPSEAAARQWVYDQQERDLDDDKDRNCSETSPPPFDLTALRDSQATSPWRVAFLPAATLARFWLVGRVARITSWA
jgi:hypothetical protein